MKIDKRISSALNAKGAFTGEVTHAENIGKTVEELVALWNAEHPEDPITG